ncbi:MAG: hypothetical protein ACRDI2_24965 [Chloroflexota bacterium]
MTDFEPTSMSSASSMAAPRPAAPADSAQALRWKWGLYAIFTISGVVLVALTLLAFRYDDAAQATTLLSAVTGLLGTIAGLYLGAQAGGAGLQQAQTGQDQAMAALMEAQREATRWAAMVEPDVAERELAARDAVARQGQDANGGATTRSPRPPRRSPRPPRRSQRPTQQADDELYTFDVEPEDEGGVPPDEPAGEGPRPL